MIYFIRSTQLGQIKIGTTLSLAKRAAQLTREHKAELEVLAILPGDQTREFELHHRFGHLRMEGEWFDPGPDLLEFIREHGRPWSGIVDEPAAQTSPKVFSLTPAARHRKPEATIQLFTARLYGIKRMAELLAASPEDMDRVTRAELRSIGEEVSGLLRFFPGSEERLLRIYDDLDTRKKAAQ